MTACCNIVVIIFVVISIAPAATMVTGSCGRKPHHGWAGGGHFARGAGAGGGPTTSTIAAIFQPVTVPGIVRIPSVAIFISVFNHRATKKQLLRELRSPANFMLRQPSVACRPR